MTLLCFVALMGAIVGSLLTTALWSRTERRWDADDTRRSLLELRGRLALATRAERVRIAALLRSRATTLDVRAGFTAGVDDDAIGAAREAGGAAALLAVAMELEAETRAEDEQACATEKGDDP